MMLFKTAESGRVSVMESKLRDQKRIVLDAIDDTMFSGYPARPKTGQSMLQGFGLSYSSERIPLNLPDQPVDPLDHLPVLFFHTLPVF
jgi:hypothetical protein